MLPMRLRRKLVRLFTELSAVDVSGEVHRSVLVVPSIHIRIEAEGSEAWLELGYPRLYKWLCRLGWLGSNARSTGVPSASGWCAWLAATP